MKRRKTYVAAGAAVAAVAAGVLAWVLWPGGSGTSRPAQPAAALGISVGEQSQAPAKASPNISMASAVAALRAPVSGAPAGTSLPSLSAAATSRNSVPARPTVELPRVQTPLPQKVAPNVAVAGAMATLLAGGGKVAGTNAPVVGAQTPLPPRPQAAGRG